MTIRSQILGLIYAIKGSRRATEGFNLWPNAKMRDPVSIQSEKQEEISGLTVHIHQLPTPDKERPSALVTKYSETDKCSCGTGTLRSGQVVVYNFNE